MSDSSKSALSLISTHKGYSESEQRIVDYILEHQSEAPLLTAAQLSRAAATSEATVSRFCRKLGFGSFRSFQFSLARDLESQRSEGLTDEVSLDNMEQSLKNILAAKVSELNATIDGIDHDTLAAVVHAFKNAGAIEFAAVGNTNAVALDATFKFSQLGLRCVSSTISETSIGFALTLRPGDVIVLISNSGKSRRLNRMAKAARGCGATVVVISSDSKSPLARLADYTFNTVNHEALLTTGDFAFSKISATMIIEVIYNFLLPEIEDAREHISYYEELIQPDKVVE
ncbi:MAG: MurR/RpiR family transcriptional regulator [Collinsella sp.]|nr:MurR/RpiR family transcriptional regulator [Collinsella sp.]